MCLSSYTGKGCIVDLIKKILYTIQTSKGTSFRRSPKGSLKVILSLEMIPGIDKEIRVKDDRKREKGVYFWGVPFPATKQIKRSGSRTLWRPFLDTSSRIKYKQFIIYLLTSFLDRLSRKDISLSLRSPVGCMYHSQL